MLKDGFCDFAFGSAQNDRVGGSAGKSENFISERPSIRLSGALCMGYSLMLYEVIWIVDVPIGYID